jgi:uncharacterized circularly permuted ATP-grasp superfamily protein/uncharacterized alpha-E superfamily protein
VTPPEERPEVASPDNDWAAGYRAGPADGAYDELSAPSGEPRPAWEKPISMLRGLGHAELRRRWEHARQLLHEHGVSYDGYGDPQGATRPWNLSPIPVVVGGSEWAVVASGLSQRARLLDAILADLYGPRRLLSDGDLPPEMAFAHSAFLRPCVGIVPPGNHFLPLYCADLGRSPSGNIVVLSDRTRTPSGVGYALENRIVLSRTLPEVFRECHVERLALFFRAMLSSLRELAPKNRDNPRIVLLTPGPYNATYFEQAFLAQYLGLPLVQGADLTVRDTRVYLKMLGGLQPVDVILRRVRDDYCDPLELRPESTLGVPGLVQAARAGTVALANPLGSGLLQTPAIVPFLPALCRKLLGEELALESVRTFWCGDRESLSYVEARLSQLVIRPAFPSGSVATVFAGNLSVRALEDLRARVRADPRMYVAQEPFVLSAVPTLSGDALAPAHLWMRAYLVVSGDSYEVMPGALSRVGGPEESRALSLRPGGESKDTWILAGGPVSSFSLLRPTTAPAELSRGGGDLPSRVADNFFWLGRYTERAEGTARLARAIGTRLSDQGGGETELPGDLDALFRALEARTGVPHPKGEGEAAGEGMDRPGWLVAGEHRFLMSVLDTEAPGTLRAAVADAHRVARTVRDRVSGDAWRTIAQVNQELFRGAGVTGPRALGVLLDLINRVVLALAAFGGVAMDSMSRGLAWRFLDAGRRIERAIHMVALLKATVARASVVEGPVLEALLEVADSSMTYRRRYLATLQAAPVVDLLLTDETNPRSVLFQTDTLGMHIEALPREPGARTPQQRLILEAAAQLRLADVSEICTTDEDGERPGLLVLLERLEQIFPELSSSLSSVYLSHATTARQLQGQS